MSNVLDLGLGCPNCTQAPYGISEVLFQIADRVR